MFSETVANNMVAHKNNIDIIVFVNLLLSFIKNLIISLLYPIWYFASSAVCEKLASNDDFEIVVRQIENLVLLQFV